MIPISPRHLAQDIGANQMIAKNLPSPLTQKTVMASPRSIKDMKLFQSKERR
jgi:hypothetical protein